MYPEHQDIYLLQQLAEAASRSGETPFIVLGLLHQGFSAYTDHLNTASKQEWEKVAGRFEEIVFNQPLDQVVLLLSAALGIRPKTCQDTKKKLKVKCNMPLRRDGMAPAPLRKQLHNKAVKLFPLDPLAVPNLFVQCNALVRAKDLCLVFFNLRNRTVYKPLRHNYHFKRHDCTESTTFTIMFEQI